MNSTEQSIPLPAAPNVQANPPSPAPVPRLSPQPAPVQRPAAPRPVLDPAPAFNSQLFAALDRQGAAAVLKSPANGAATDNLPVPLQFIAPSLPSLQTRPAGKPRNGKIAHLPALERDLVNRMLANNLPHKRIAAAVEECGFHVTARNISNWKTRGGYKEWRAAQEQALELRTFQDNLTGFLRRHDAGDLPEVGLQSAATTLSALLLRPDLMRELIADPQKYSKLIDLQCRLAREIQALQKNRDDKANSLGRPVNPERLKRQDEHDVEHLREVYSSKPGKSPRERDIPHRNFIPRDLDPVAPTYRLSGSSSATLAAAGLLPGLSLLRGGES